jgi:hypothetical protein
VHQGGLIPVNVSFSNTLGIFLSFISTYQFPAGLVPGISIIVCLLAGGSLLVFGNRRSIFHNLVIVTCLPILVPGVTFNYYLVLLIVPLLFLASDLAADGGISKDGISSERNLSFSSMPMFNNRWIGTLFTATYLLLLIPWAIPWSLVVTSIQGSPPPITGINWAILSRNFVPAASFLGGIKEDQFREIWVEENLASYHVGIAQRRSLGFHILFRRDQEMVKKMKV